MSAEQKLEYINRIRAGGVLENGELSFLHDWEPVKFLGRGSYGFVYEIRRGREHCAVKIIDMGAHPEVDYSVEINALTMLRGQKHATNIYEYAYVSINHSGFTDRYLLIRMNLLNDLPESMNEDEVIDMGAQICEILSVCHSGETKIYHCDIKPENILVANDGTYILADFGASNITQRSHKSSGHAGTPLFEAPEMLRFESFDGRSDLFSLGITMYALLNNGLPPFARNNNDADAIRIRLEGKRTIPAADGISPELLEIIRKMCADDADKRYRNAEESGKALSALLSEREAKRSAAEEAKRKAEEEAKRRAEEAAGQKAERERRAAEESIYGKTSIPGRGKPPATETIPGPVQKTKRRPFGIIATAAALVAAIVCGVIWLPGAVRNSRIKNLSDVSGVSVGDHVYFGSYPQTGAGEVQPVEWRVLAIEDGSALMISEYLLDAKPYNDEFTDVTWETCTLRKWLNEDFYDAAFTAEEKSRIVQRTNENPDNPTYGTKGWNTTYDIVFCLSIDEASRFFSNTTKEQDGYTTYPDRMAKLTAYAKKRGAFVDSDWGTGWWLLRSPGFNSHYAASVDFNGYIDDPGIHVDIVNYCVRPVVLVSLSDASTAADAQNADNAVPYLSEVTGVSVGDHVYFGSYPQTEAGEVQPVEWRVLAIEDGRALMISEYLLDAKPYNDEFTDVTWETCTLRKWLNEDFYDAAFTAEEKSRIVQRTNENPDNPTHGTEGGNTTKDRVFCLSIDEASKYFYSDDDRKAKPTAYAIKNGAYVNSDYGTGWWWLRSPGNLGYSAAYVNSNGDIDDYGLVHDDNYCVRPVVLASLAAQNSENAVSAENTVSYLSDAANVSVGDHVYFGSYPQTEAGEVQPVEWRVLAVENGSALMISEYLLDAKPYNDESTDVTWETCTLRKWLNEDFYDAAFTAEEKSRIVQRTNENPDNPDDGTEGGNTTKDRVFCLSIDEASRYFSNTTKEQDGYTTYPDRMAKPTAYAEKRGAYVDSDWGTGWWWLRSPGSSSGRAPYASGDGDVYGLILFDVDNVDFCVRPVVFASL